MLSVQSAPETKAGRRCIVSNPNGMVFTCFETPGRYRGLLIQFVRMVPNIDVRIRFSALHPNPSVF